MKHAKVGFALLLLVNFALVQNMMAYQLQDHVISIEEVQKQVGSKSSQRHDNIQEIQKLLRHAEVQKHLGYLYDLEKIELAVSSLDGKTLEDLANRSRFANDQLQAGFPTRGLVIAAVVVVAIGLTVFLLYYHALANN